MLKLTTFIYAVAITAAIFTIPMGIEAATQHRSESVEASTSPSTSLLARKARGLKPRKMAKKFKKSGHKKRRHHKKAASRHGRKIHARKVG
jgi:hypothetical protein